MGTPEPPKVNRRRFLRHVGAGAIAAAAAGGVGCYLYDRQRAYVPATSQATTITSTSQPMSSTSVKTNSSPVVSRINVKPAYINPTTEYAVELSCDVYDPDNDPLQTTWLIDGKEVSREGKYSIKLLEGAHDIILKVHDVNDGRTLSETTRHTTITVEPDQIYPTKKLHIKYKGMRLDAGRWTIVPLQKINEQLDAIHEELGCNAVIIYAHREFEDNLIAAGKLALQKGFDRVYITPMYLDESVDETITAVANFIPKVKSLREMSPSVVFMVGHEFGLDMKGIIPGETWLDRFYYASSHNDWMVAVRSTLPRVFGRIISLVKQSYGYQIAYAAAMWETNLVPWSDHVFESVGIDAYICDSYGWNEGWIAQQVSSLQKFGKPVHSTEWGCQTFTGAAQGYQLSQETVYDEDEQANYIARYCNMLDKSQFGGAFYTDYNDEYNGPKNSYSLYNGVRRKKGFYMYKSYQRSPNVP